IGSPSGSAGTAPGAAARCPPSTAGWASGRWLPTGTPAAPARRPACAALRSAPPAPSVVGGGDAEAAALDRHRDPAPPRPPPGPPAPRRPPARARRRPGPPPPPDAPPARAPPPPRFRPRPTPRAPPPRRAAPLAGLLPPPLGGAPRLARQPVQAPGALGAPL